MIILNWFLWSIRIWVKCSHIHYPTDSSLLWDGFRSLEGFYENMKHIRKLEENITTVSICKKGRRNQAEYDRESSEEFKDGQRFRAGCEGRISALKRVFKLGRCLFKGFRN